MRPSATVERFLTAPALSALMTLLLMAALAGCSGGGAPPATADDPVDTQDPDAAVGTLPEQEEDVPEPTVAPLAQATVRVYFPSNSSDGLVIENHKIFETTTPGDRAKQIIAGLIEGPESNRAMRAVPRGTHLRQAYVLKSGVAYLDFSRDLADGLGGGSTREMLTVYAIVDSVARNVPEIKRVGLLIEGKIPETLNGHMDLRYPLRPNYSIVLKARVRPADTDPPVRVAGAL